MVSRDESGGHSSKKNLNARKNSFVHSPVSADKTSTSREVTASPQATRKSKRLDKGTPPSTPPVNKKSERVETRSTPSPLRRSDRGKKDLSSGSLGTKHSPKERSPLDSKRKKEKNLIQVTMESRRAELDHGLKRVSARKYRGQFKKQRILEPDLDDGEDLERPEGKLRDGHGGASNGALEESVSTSQDCPEEENNEIHVHSRLNGNPERLPTNCSASENMDISESGGSVGSDGPEVAEATTSPSSTCGTYSLIGSCDVCSKSRRVGYDSLEQELCSCSPLVDEDQGCAKDRSDFGAAVTSDSQRDGHQNVCALCNKPGELLCCVGKGCKKCYHVCCFNPSLTETLPGVWHCHKCVKKKLLFGVHSVSEGVESIWDVREVEVSNGKGVRQKQYLVKYHGLSHIHNHWVPENQLLFENPGLVSNFLEKKETVRWSREWTVPHHLLRKRSLKDKIYIASSAVISVCDYEWLVKWHGLDYDHATWELDNSDFLSSSLGQNLIKSYEVHREMAKQEINKPYPGPVMKLPELPASRSNVNENLVLKNVNKLREYLFKSLNGVVFDDQERAMTVIFTIQSLTEICWPFLLVTTPGSLSHWEAEFTQLMPSLDVVVYGGSADTRKGIRASEFYDEEGRIMARVLLSSIDAVSEDLEILRSIKWKAVLIDECQQSVISNALEKIKVISMDSTILLVSGQIKDATSEYVNLLSLLEPHGDFDKPRGLRPETYGNPCKLKDRLSRFIAYGRTSQASKFIEYWIPVQISKFQLEQYCYALLSNVVPLCSSSRNDSIGVLQDILLTIRKCCSHPYILDGSVQERLIAEGCLAAELLDIGIKACGKLKLLDVMLTEIKARDLNVLIIFQNMGSVGSSTGDILDDFLRQRFGPSTYERVDFGINPSKKQAAVHRFNKKEAGQFVFLLENRACSSIIKLSSVDVVIIYDSDWNPSTDFRALQKISVDSKVEQIKVLRLYSSFTIEEKTLILAKQNLNLDNHLQNVSRATSETLLSWGAAHLFSKLDEYHAATKSNAAIDSSSEQQFFDEVIKEFQSILSDNHENTNPNTIISEAKLGVGSYSANIPVFGEAKVKLKDGEEPHVFWKELFEGKDPKWKHLNLNGPSPRNRKRVRYWERPITTGEEIGNDDTVKKRKKLVNENLVPPSVQVESGSHQTTPIVASPGGLSRDNRTESPGPSTINVCNQSESIQRGQSPLVAEVSVNANELKSLHTSLLGETEKLCQTLKLPEDVTHAARKFLEYVMKNHRVSSDSRPIVQAFQLSLCWAAASITKQKLEKKDTLLLAKQLLNYQCTEEQTISVYSKMRRLKRMYLQSAEVVTDLERDNTFAEDMEIEGKTANEEHSEIGKNILRIQRKCDKRMKKLVKKHQLEIQEFQEIWESNREELEKDHRLESAFIRSIHSQGQIGSEKLKLLEDKFAEKMKEHNLLKDAQLKELKAKQVSAIDEERKKAADWLAKTKACSIGSEDINGQHLLNSQFDDNAECLQPHTSVNIVDNENRENDVVPSTSSISAPAEDEEIVCAERSAPVEQVSEDTQSAVPNLMLAGELSNAANKECDKTGKIVSSDDLVGQGGGSEEAQQVQKDKIGQSLVSSQPQESDAPAVQNESTSQIETPIIDEIVTPVNQNSGLLHNSPVNQAPATENHDQGRSFSQTAEHRGAEVPSQEPISRREENLDLHSNHLDIGPSVEPSTILQNDEAVNVGNLHRAITQLDINAGNLQRPFLLWTSRQPTATNSAPSMLTDPLQNEIERIRKETAQLDKSHEDTVAQTKSDCEKEIEEVVSQIRKKYELKHQEAEAAFRLKRNELDKNQNKVFRNKVLSEAFRSKCLDLRPSGVPGMRQGVPSNSRQQLHQPPPNRHSPGPSGSQSVRNGPSGSQPARNGPSGSQQAQPIPSGSQPTQPMLSGSQPTRPVFSGSQPTRPMLSGSHPTRPMLSGSHPTRPMLSGSQPTRPMLSGSQPTRPMLSGSQLTQPMQQQARVHPSRPMPMAIQSMAPPSVAARPVGGPHSASSLSGTPPAPTLTPTPTHRPTPSPTPRPLVINAISPTTANPRTGGNDLRSMAPHLQPFRPSPSAPSTSPSIPPHLQPLRPPAASSTQMLPPSQPGWAPRAAAQVPMPNLIGMPAPPNPSQSMQGLLQAMDRRASSSGPEPRPSLLPDISSTFGALEQSDLEILGSVRGNQTPAVEKNVVCLSDDES